MSEVAVVAYDHPASPALVTASLQATGFAVLTRHPIAPGLVARVQDEWRAWFATEDKYRYVPGPGHQDGYHPMAESERAVGAEAPDLKEFFHWYPWGRHPAGVSDGAARLYAAGSALGAEVLRWVDAHTPADVARRFMVPLAGMLEGGRRTLLRILHYPPLSGAEPAVATRAAPHEDVNLLTVLPAADQPGLRVRGRDGRWHDIPADPGTVVINVGDMLALASGGHYPSATHDVTRPVGAAAATGRISTPLFLHPADDVVLAPGVTAFTFLSERLRAIRGIDLVRDA